MTMTDGQLKTILIECDPAGCLSHERTARLEARILEGALNTPQTSAVAGVHAAHHALFMSFPLSSGVLAACALIMLGIVAGQNLSPVYPARRATNFSIGVMANPWQNWMAAQGALQP
ncbi:MAG: hypothetical protein PHY92_05800 [Alphaproteobacteria bacterium]|nr:hypothetical protein [Alphaproteobacteria bacterium]